MRQVIFKEVGMYNFGPYIDPMKLTFVPDTLVLISGPNGIGKTMMLDSIPFTLYGITSKGARGDDVVNNTVGKNCHTWLEFNVDNIPYRIDRYHKYKKLNNTVILNRDGTDILKGQKEVLPEIERLIAPRKLFMNTLMFGQKVKDFFTDLTDSEKKEIFKKILELENYMVYGKLAHERLKVSFDLLQKVGTEIQVNIKLRIDSEIQIEILEDKKEAFEDLKKRDIVDMNERIDISNEKLSDYREMLTEFDLLGEELEHQTTVKNELERHISTIETEIELYHKDLMSKQQLTINEINTKANASKTRISKTLSNQIQELSNELKNSNDKLNYEFNLILKDKGDLNTEIQSYRMEHRTLDIERINLQENVIDKEVSICPTCEQEIDSQKTKELKIRLDVVVNTMNQLKEKEDIGVKAFQKKEKEEI